MGLHLERRALADSEKKRLLNQPNPRKNPEPEFRKKRMFAASAAAPSESDLEKGLEISDAFRERFNLDKVMRQWPVGLFDGRVTKGGHIFTGGKSAIDLIGIRGDTLVLFELKKAGNRKAGAVSELLFYANVMRDAIGDARVFEFESTCAKKNCAIAPEDITRLFQDLRRVAGAKITGTANSKESRLSPIDFRAAHVRRTECGDETAVRG